MKNILLLLAILMTIVVASCTKAGLGGQNTIIATPQHHGKDIPGCVVYVKFGATELPGTSPSDFDVNFSVPFTKVPVTISGLMKGNYYLYAVGYDTTISQTVTGGMPVSISESAGETLMALPVTEN
ncbi:MAG: hypothetical protein WCL14_02385 [Bacteroidota bacterium]